MDDISLKMEHRVLASNESNSSYDCAHTGGCPVDYIAVAITCIVFTLVCNGICFVIAKRRNLHMNAKKVSVLVVQACAGLIYLSGAVLSRSVLKLSRRPFWQNCYIWQIWLEGPFGFGLLLSCHIARAYRLYYIFVGRRLPPLKYYQLLPLLLLPWFALAAVIQGLNAVHQKPQCSFTIRWQIPIACIHAAYPTVLVYSAWRLRNVQFKFNEFKELLKGVVVCAILLAVWAALFVAEKIVEVKNHRNPGLVVTSRFVVVVVVNVSVLLLFWIPVSKPICDLFHSQKSSCHRYGTMGQALGVPHSGLVPPNPTAVDFSGPLESLLEHKQFRQSYLAFADSRMAGEIVDFYDEVREFNKIPVGNTVQRVYMAEHIIDKYIKPGSEMEINISHQMRSDILNTKDLADLNLFKRAVREALKMMETNLSKEYWKSSFFDELKAELEADAEAQYGDYLEQTDLDDRFALRKHYDSAPDNPFDRGCLFSGELCKESWSEKENFGVSPTNTSELADKKDGIRMCSPSSSTS